jgi:hypothetical protein
VQARFTLPLIEKNRRSTRNVFIGKNLVKKFSTSTQNQPWLFPN